jgi:hypothetical protein
VRVVVVADRRTGCRRRARDRRSTPLVVPMLRCRLPHHIDTTTPPPAPAAPTPAGRDSHTHVPPDQRPVSRGAGDHASAHGSPGRLRAPDEVATTSRLPNRDTAPAFRRANARPAPRGTAHHDHVRRRVSRRLLQGRPGALEASHAGHGLRHLGPRRVGRSDVPEPRAAEGARAPRYRDRFPQRLPLRLDTTLRPRGAR